MIREPASGGSDATRASPAEKCGFSRIAIQSASSRTKNVIGATLVGITLRCRGAAESFVARTPPESKVAGCGDNRPHPTAPVMQS